MREKTGKCLMGCKAKMQLMNTNIYGIGLPYAMPPCSKYYYDFAILQLSPIL